MARRALFRIVRLSPRTRKPARSERTLSMSKPQAQALKPHVLVLDAQQSYKRLEEDALIRVVREHCRHFALRRLPYRLSPVILGLPGLLLHLFLLAAVHTFERARWMYVLWVVCRVLHFCLDAM